MVVSHVSQEEENMVEGRESPYRGLPSTMSILRCLSYVLLYHVFSLIGIFNNLKEERLPWLLQERSCPENQLTLKSP